MKDKFEGMLRSLAYADALGAQTEGLSPEAIRSAYGRLRHIVPRVVLKENIVKLGYPPGAITDDTLFTLQNIESLFRDLKTKRRIDPLTGNRSWVALTDRAQGTYLAPIAPGYSGRSAEIRWLLKANLDQTLEDYGCSCLMGISPLAAKNLGCRKQIAADVGQFIRFGQSSETLSATTALAYAYAEAAQDRTTVERIIKAAMAGARAGFSGSGPNVVLRNIRLAFGARKLADERSVMDYLGREVGLSHHAKHVLPVALGIFAFTRGDAYRSAVIGTNIGGDTDSFAAIAAALGGLLRGENFPADIRQKVAENGVPFRRYAQMLDDIRRMGTRAADGTLADQRGAP